LWQPPADYASACEHTVARFTASSDAGYRSSGPAYSGADAQNLLCARWRFKRNMLIWRGGAG